MYCATGAFITFESEEGLQRCLSLDNKNTKVRILGQRPLLKAAPEPTNVIWENRQFTSLQRFIRGIFVVLVILILLAMSFAIILTLKKKARESNNKYQ